MDAAIVVMPPPPPPSGCCNNTSPTSASPDMMDVDDDNNHNTKRPRVDGGASMTMMMSSSGGGSTMEATTRTLKRQKLPSGKSIPDHIGDNELASAFALASLASMSPKRSPHYQQQQQQQADPESPTESREQQQAESRQEETDFGSSSPYYYPNGGHSSQRGPQQHDVRSPVRSPTNGQSKRVTFSDDTRDISRRGSRRFSLPPRSRCSLPRRLERHGSPPLPHQPHQPHQQPLPGGMYPPPSSPATAPWLRPRLMDQQHPGSYAMPPPALPPMMSGSDKWICDYCNVAAFDTYQEACAHEEMCRVRYHHNHHHHQHRAPPPPSPPLQQQHHPTPQHGHWPVMPHSRIAYAASTSQSNNSSRVGGGGGGQLQLLPPPSPGMTMMIRSPSSSAMGPPSSPGPPTGPAAMSTMMDEHTSITSAGMVSAMMGPPAPVPVPTASRTWFDGCTSLSIPNSDTDWLSALNCYIREECVEAFSASEEDVAKISKRGRITVQQVGIRCRFCKHQPRDEALSGATSYPMSLAGIYESVKRWQKMHLEVCVDMPPEARARLHELASSNSWVPTTRQYWADSAKALGMVDTQDGIRFGKDPSDAQSRQAFTEELQKAVEKPEHRPTEGEEMHKEGTLANGEDIVYADDMPMVPPYVYFLMRQVETTHFTESDRFVARSKGPVGYSGFQCRHCKGHAGLGKYFPVSSKSLSTNSTSQNIHSHLLKCRKVSPYIKEQLITLKDEKSKAPRLEPGWRRIFFEKIWSRLHGPDAVTEV